MSTPNGSDARLGSNSPLISGIVASWLAPPYAV